MTIKIRVAAVLLAVTMALCACGERSLPPEQLRLLAFGAVLSEKNAMSNTALFAESGEYRTACKKSLEDNWGVFDHDSAAEVIETLINPGSREFSEERYNVQELFNIAAGKATVDDAQEESLAGIRTAYGETVSLLVAEYGYTSDALAGIRSIAAWDYDRAVTIARWCAGCDFITEDEAWAYLREVSALSEKAYTGWDEYFAAVVLGRAIAFAEPFGDRAVADRLLVAEDSIYKQVSFAGNAK